MLDQAMVAYLSMEIGVDAQLPTCCGGLGVLAGDTVKGSAELNFPLVGVSLRHHKGYFEQEIENYQQKDGSVIIPEVLRPYLYGKERIP